MSWPSLVADVLPAVVLIAYGAIEIAATTSPAPAVARLVGAAAFGAVVLVRRIALVPAVIAFGLVAVLRAADGQLGTGAHSVTLGLLILGWSLGTGSGGWPSRLAALALLEAGMAVAVQVANGHPVAADFVVLGLLPLAAFGVGSAVRRWRAEAQFERARQRELSAEREVHPRRAVAQERARVARELHDVVAHSVSIISVQAGAAEALAGRDAARARESVEAVLTAARQALAELRLLLDLLGAEHRSSASYGPQPGLASLDELAANAREIGLQIELINELDGTEVPAGVQLTAFRIVQEALTNAHKHAGRVPVGVRLAGRQGSSESRSAATGPTPPRAAKAPATDWWGCASGCGSTEGHSKPVPTKTVDGSCAQSCRSKRSVRDDEDPDRRRRSVGARRHGRHAQCTG